MGASRGVNSRLALSYVYWTGGRPIPLAFRFFLCIRIRFTVYGVDPGDTLPPPHPSSTLSNVDFAEEPLF